MAGFGFFFKVYWLSKHVGNNDQYIQIGNIIDWKWLWPWLEEVRAEKGVTNEEVVWGNLKMNNKTLT